MLRHPLPQTPKRAWIQQRKAAGMAAGDWHRHVHRAENPQQLPNPGCWMLRRLIDVQINRAPKALRQRQETSQRLARAPAPTRRFDHTTDHPLGRCDLRGQLLSLRGGPMGDGHERHQLELDALLPVLTSLRQHLPAAGGPWSQAVDVRANGPKAMAPGQPQSTLTAFVNPISGAGAMFAHVGLHRTGVGP